MFHQRENIISREKRRTLATYFGANDSWHSEVWLSTVFEFTNTKDGYIKLCAWLNLYSIPHKLRGIDNYFHVILISEDQEPQNSIILELVNELRS